MARKNQKGLIETLVRRGKAGTPPFFKKLRLIGITLTAIGGALIAAPVALPVAVVTVAGYLVVAGSVATAISQVTVKNEWRYMEEEKEMLNLKKQDHGGRK